MDFRQIQINVNAVAGALVIAQFSSSPEFDVDPGQCVSFQWRADGAVNRGIGARRLPTLDYALVAGSFNDCPPGAVRRP